MAAFVHARSRLVALCALALCMGCDSIAELMEPTPEQSTGIAPGSRGFAPAAPGALDTATAAELLERMRASSRVGPDRRFVAAIARLPTFNGGTASVPTVRYADGAHEIVRGDHVLGRVRELAGFAELFALVQAEAKAVWAASGHKLSGSAEPPATDSLLPLADIQKALRETDARWNAGERRAADIRRAAQAMALLTTALVDDLGIGDAVSAHALATLALAEAATGEPMLREQALLARALSYMRSAEQLATGLPENDPVHAFAQNRTAELTQSSDATAAMLGAVLVRSVGSAAQRVDARAKLRDSGPATYADCALLADQKQGTSDAYRWAASAVVALRELLGKMPGEVKRSVGGVIEAPSDDAKLAAVLALPMNEMLPAIEALLGEMQGQKLGPFFAGDAVAAFYAAQAFSALDSALSFQRDMRGAPSDADDLLARFGAPTSDLGKQYERYAANLTRAERRTLKPEQLVTDVRELTWLGPAAFERVADTVLDQGSYSSALVLFEAVITERCDSRIECRALEARVATYGTKDIAVAERYRKALVEEAAKRYSSQRLVHVGYARDKAAYLAALADPSIAIHSRSEHLRNRSEWLDKAEIKRAYDGLLNEAMGKDAYSIRDDYARWLLEQKEPFTAVSVIDGYLAQPPSEGEHPLTRLSLQTLKGRALLESGKPEDAWKLVGPTLPTQYGGSFWRGALIQSARGNVDEAISIAKANLQRYPGIPGVALLSEIYWRHDKNEEAAQLLEEWSNRISLGEWLEHIAKAFGLAFEGQSAERAEAAARAIVTKKIDPLGLRTMFAGNKRLSPEQRFRVYAQLPSSGFVKHLDAGRLYTYMKQWKGEAEAHAEIERRLPAEPPGNRDPFSQHGYTSEHYDLIWTFVPDPGANHPQAPFIWLMRTASYLRTPERPAEWREKLDRFYATDNAHPQAVMGRYLLGKTDAESLWKVATGAEHRPLAGWVLGLKAEVEGDLETAILWYRATVAAARGNSGEMQWASNSLETMRNAQKSLALLSEEAKGKGL